MELSEQEKGLYKDALRIWGSKAQYLMVVEESAELIVALAYWRRRVSNYKKRLTEAVADEEIVCGQMMLMHGEKTVAVAMRRDSGGVRDQIAGRMDRCLGAGPFAELIRVVEQFMVQTITEGALTHAVADALLACSVLRDEIGGNLVDAVKAERIDRLQMIVDHDGELQSEGAL